MACCALLAEAERGENVGKMELQQRRYFASKSGLKLRLL
jgi:hypothetical protein